MCLVHSIFESCLNEYYINGVMRKPAFCLSHSKGTDLGSSRDIIESSISISELFPESCPYNVYRKDRTLDGGVVMLLIHKDISHLPITKLENDSESVWIRVFASKTSHFVASWYRPPGGDLATVQSRVFFTSPLTPAERGLR